MASGGFVRINFAPAEELLTVPGIGPNIAAAIVELRISRSNMTPEFLKLLLRGKIPKGALECLDFTPNHKFSSDEDYNPALAERADAEQQTSTYGRGYISEPDSEGSSRVSDLEDDQHVKTFMRQLDDAVTLRPPPNPELVKMEAVKARPPPKRHVKQMEPVGPLNRAIDVDRQRQDHRQRYREPYGVHDDYEVYADEYEPQHLNVRPPRGVNILNTLPRNLQYDGKSTWMAFEQKFTRYAQSSAWSANQCLDSLCWCLTGKVIGRGILWI